MSKESYESDYSRLFGRTTKATPKPSRNDDDDDVYDGEKRSKKKDKKDKGGKKKEKKGKKLKKILGDEMTYKELMNSDDGIYLVRSPHLGDKFETYVVKVSGEFPTTINTKENFRNYIESVIKKVGEKNLQYTNPNKVMYDSVAFRVMLPKDLEKGIIGLVFPKRAAK